MHTRILYSPVDKNQKARVNFRFMQWIPKVQAVLLPVKWSTDTGGDCVLPVVKRDPKDLTNGYKEACVHTVFVCVFVRMQGLCTRMRIPASQWFSTVKISRAKSL